MWRYTESMVREPEILRSMKWCIVLLVFLFLGAGASPRSQQGPGDIKSADCGACHEDQYRKFNRSAHYLLEVNPRFKKTEHACEACHGSGKEHIDGGGDASKIFSFKSSPAPAINKQCLECHGSQGQRHGYEASLHGKSSLSCVDCHSIHSPQEKTNLLRGKASALCLSCHAEMRAEFSKPFRHKVSEGGMSCIDCHDQHGGPNAVQLKFAAGSQTACVKCHSDKQGPFVFEHAPLRLEGCTSCHAPHGSINPKMLRRAQVRFLCLECHTGAPGILSSQPPAFHDTRSARFQNCTSCHVKIHGSNIDRLLFQ